MRYDYKCEEHGVMEITHSIKESREGRKCPLCDKILKPLISKGASLLFTGRPPWAYNDVIKAVSKTGTDCVDLNAGFRDTTTITDKRDKSPFKGMKKRIDRSMGDYNAQW